MSRFFYFQRKRRNAGYTERVDGTALSIRASFAEEDGKFTAGKFRTTYGVSKKAFDALVLIGVIVTKEWHHTGKSYTKHDFYEWNDDCSNTFRNIYDSNKNAILSLVDELEHKTWMYEKKKFIHNVETYDSFKTYSIHDELDLLLTDDEQTHRRNCHEEISNSGITSSHERYLLHKKVDERFEALASERINDESVKLAYERKYGEHIRENEERSQFNTSLRDKNLATDGKENVLIRIASFFYEDEDMYDMAYKACMKAKEADFYAGLEAQRKAERKEQEEQQKAYEALRAEASKKAKAYLDKCIKSGKACAFTRISAKELTDLHYSDTVEMNGRYGWFEAKDVYNMPKYYSGYKFSDKRQYNHYAKLKTITI